MLKSIMFASRVFLVYAALCVGCFLMLKTIMGYTAFRDDVQFLAFKQDYIHNPIWKGAFYIHVFSAVFALLAGFTQFSPQLLKDNPKLHRLIGKLYVAVILLINTPTGLILAVCANGGVMGKTAFLLLDVLWFFFTWKAFVYARQRRFAEHKNFMIRSYALTFSAITLRTWNLILSNSLNLDRTTHDAIDAWLGFVPNLMVAEMIIRWRVVKNGLRASEAHVRNRDQYTSNDHQDK